MSNCPNCQNHESHNGFTTGLILGSLLGVVAGYAVSTEKGKEALKNLSGEAKELLDNIAENETVQEAIATVKENIESLKQTATEVAEKKEVPRPRFFLRSGSPLKP